MKQGNDYVQPAIITDDLLSQRRRETPARAAHHLNEYTRVAAGWLREGGYNERIIYAILGHNDVNEATHPRNNLLSHALYAGDLVAGMITACSVFNFLSILLGYLTARSSMVEIPVICHELMMVCSSSPCIAPQRIFSQVLSDTPDQVRSVISLDEICLMAHDESGVTHLVMVCREHRFHRRQQSSL